MSYEMFTAQGNAAVALLVKNTIRQVNEAPYQSARERLTILINEGMEHLSKLGHGEVYDTEPRANIRDTIRLNLKMELDI